MGQFCPQTHQHPASAAPACRTHEAPHLSPRRTALHFLTQSSDHPHLRPHTQTWVPPAWAWPGPSPGRAKITYHPGPERQPSEAKFNFHQTRPHPQASSHPFVWKKRGLLVTTSSGSALPAHLRPCMPLPAFLILSRASSAQLRWPPAGTGSPQSPPAFLLPHKPGSQPTREQGPGVTLPSPTGSSDSMGAMLPAALPTQLSPGQLPQGLLSS